MDNDDNHYTIRRINAVIESLEEYFKTYKDGLMAMTKHSNILSGYEKVFGKN